MNAHPPNGTIRAGWEAKMSQKFKREYQKITKKSRYEIIIKKFIVTIL